jgi:hypothetical protein
MHPTIQLEIARSRAADMQGQAERARVARTARAGRPARHGPRSAGRLAARPAQPGSHSTRRLAAPRALALRLLRLS